MKRFTPAVGTLAALMLLAACGSQSSDAPAPDTSAEVTVPDATVPAEEAATDAPEAPAESAAEVVPASLVEVAGLSGDPVAGKKAFNQCAACHSMTEGQNRVGPSLYGIMGEKAAEVPNFKFSKAMVASNIIWSPETLFEYLDKPNKMVPGTTMAFAGIPNKQKRADVVAYVVANGEI